MKTQRQMPEHRPTVNVNLLPDNHRGRRLQGRQVALILALVLVISMVPVLYNPVSASGIKTSELQGELNVLNQKMTMRQATTEKRARMVEMIKDYESIAGERGKITENLAVIQAAGEEAGILVSSVLYVAGKGSLTVSCLDVGHSQYEDICDAFEGFRRALYESGIFYSISYPSLDYPAKSEVKFEIQIDKPSSETS